MEYDPNKNHNVITIVRQEDGNYIGYTFKHGKMIEVRQGDPVTVIQMIITHE